MTVITSAGTGTGNQFMNPSGNVPSPNPPANPNNDPNPAQPAVPQPSDKTPKNPLAWWEEHIQFMEDFRQSQLDAGKGDPFLLPESFSSDDEDASGSGSGDASGSGSGDATSGTEDDPFGRTEGQSSQLFDVGDFSKHFEGTPPQNEREAYKLLYDFRKISGNPDPRDLDTFYNAEKNQGYNVFEKLAKEMADKQIADKDNDFTLLPGITLKEGSPQYNYFINEKFTKQYNRYFTAKPHNTMKSIYSHLYLVLHLTTDPDSGPSMGTFDEWYETAKTRIADPVEMLANVYFKVHTYGLHIFEPMNNDITPEFREYIEAERRKNPYYYLGLKDNKFHVNDIKGSFRTQLRHVPDAEIARLNAQTSRDVLRKVVQFINNARNDDKDMGEFFDKLLQEAYDPNIGILKILGLRLNEIYSLQKDNKIPVVPNFDFQTADGLINMMMFANFNTDYFYPGSADKKKGELKRWYESWKHAKDLRQDVGFNFKGKYYENFITHKNDRPYVNRAEDLPDLGETAGNDQSIGVTPAPTSTTTTSPPDGFEFSGVGGFKRPRQGDVPKYQGEDMVWDKTNPKGNEKRTFDGREILKGWMPRYKVDKDGLTKEFNTDTGKYEITTATYAQAPAPAPAQSPQDDDTTDTGADSDDETVRPPNIIPSSTRKPRPAKPVNPTTPAPYYTFPNYPNSYPTGIFQVDVLGKDTSFSGAGWVMENKDYTTMPFDDSIFKDLSHSAWITHSNAGRDEVYVNPNWEDELFSASQRVLDANFVDEGFTEELKQGIAKDLNAIGDPSYEFYDLDVLASQASYTHPDDRVKDILGYKYNRVFSDPLVAVYEKGDQTVIAYKGTDAIAEHISNAVDILSGDVLDSPSIQNMIDLVRVYMYKYPGKKVHLTGHSRGAFTSMYASAILSLEFYGDNRKVDASGFAVGGFYPGISTLLANYLGGMNRNAVKASFVDAVIDIGVKTLGLQENIALSATYPNIQNMVLSGAMFLKDQIILNDEIGFSKFGLPNINKNEDTFRRKAVVDADGGVTGLYTVENIAPFTKFFDSVSKNVLGIDRTLIKKPDAEILKIIKESFKLKSDQEIQKIKNNFYNIPGIKTIADTLTTPKYLGAGIFLRTFEQQIQNMREEEISDYRNLEERVLELPTIQQMEQQGVDVLPIVQSLVLHMQGNNPRYEEIDARVSLIEFLQLLGKMYKTAFIFKKVFEGFGATDIHALDKIINAEVEGTDLPNVERRFRSYGVKYNPNTYIFKDIFDKAGYTDIISGYAKNKIERMTGKQGEMTTQHNFPVTEATETYGTGIRGAFMTHSLINYVPAKYRTPENLQNLIRVLRNYKYHQSSDMGIPFDAVDALDVLNPGMPNLDPINPSLNNEELQEIANNYVFA